MKTVLALLDDPCKVIPCADGTTTVYVTRQCSARRSHELRGNERLERNRGQAVNL